MTNKKTIAKKATALMSAIAVSGVLGGLPAIAQSTPQSSDSSSDRMNSQNSSTPAECVPNMSQSSSGSSTSANQGSQFGNITSNPNTREFPNQTDPRAGLSDNGLNNQSSSQNNQLGSQNNNQTSNQSASYQSNRRVVSAPGSRAEAVQNNDVLSSGGATTGGESRQIIFAAGGRNDRSEGVERQTTYSSIGTQTGNTTSGQANIGATSGGFAVQNVLRANEGNRNQANTNQVNTNQASSSQINTSQASIDPCAGMNNTPGSTPSIQQAPAPQIRQ